MVPPPPTYMSERIRAEAAETRQSLRRAATMGAIFYLALLPFDLFVRSTLYPEASVGACVFWRLTGTALLGAALVVLRRGWSMGVLITFAATNIAGSVVGLAALALMFGGLTSFYVLMLAFYGIALGTFLPARWTRMTIMLLPGLVAYYTTLLVGVALDPELAWQLADDDALATFAATTILVVGLAIYAIAGGHAHWRAKSRLDDVRRLGRYHLKSLIGQGGMNEVWLAWDTMLKRDVALKLLRSHHADDTRRARFLREAQATSQLRSKNTVRLFDYGANEDGTAWIVMEYLRGQDVAALVGEHGPLAPDRALHLARQAATSLAEAHAAGIVHRDVKPANLFVLSEPDHPEAELKLLDFGIARRFDTDDAVHTIIGVVVGTPAFMAPEQLAGAAADPRSDVFALGATLYVMLTGQLPFAPSDGHFSARPPTPLVPPSAHLAHPLPASLEAFVMRCMASDPDARPADGAAFLRELAALDLALG